MYVEIRKYRANQATLARAGFGGRIICPESGQMPSHIYFPVQIEQICWPVLGVGLRELRTAEGAPHVQPDFCVPISLW